MAPRQNGRRALLRGRPQAPPPIRPPWADAARLTDLCTRCGACGDACPEGILRPGDGGFPEIRFERGECSFCGACARACPEPVFRPEGAPWRLAASVGRGCLSEAGTFCRSCGDACPAGAISFRLRPGGASSVAVDAEACTGCGACVAACPAGAVAVSPRRAA